MYNYAIEPTPVMGVSLYENLDDAVYALTHLPLADGAVRNLWEGVFTVNTEGTVSWDDMALLVHVVGPVPRVRS
jgi:hypothetical protein